MVDRQRTKIMSEIKTAVAAVTTHPAVGKLHRVKGAEGSAAEIRFRVVEHMPKFDFGARRGGVKAALRIVREPHNTESIVGADAFLATHEEVEEKS